MKPTFIAAEPVSAYDAKTHLPKLLERAAKGERFVITRHGKPVAQLIPFEAGDSVLVAQAIERVAEIRSRLARRGATLANAVGEGPAGRALTHAGHRY